jgi:hypothetical protein
MCLLSFSVHCPCMPCYMHKAVAAALATARLIAGSLGFRQANLCSNCCRWLCAFSDAAAHKALVFRQHRTPSSLSQVALALCTVSALCCSCVSGSFQFVYIVWMHVSSPMAYTEKTKKKYLCNCVCCRWSCTALHSCHPLLRSLRVVCGTCLHVLFTIYEWSFLPVLCCRAIMCHASATCVYACWSCGLLSVQLVLFQCTVLAVSVGAL